VKLILHIPDSFVCRPQGPGLLYADASDLRIYVAPVAPLPYNLQSWGDQIVMSGLPLSRLSVLRVDDTKTPSGWPLTIVESDVLGEATSRPELRRIHAMYRFLEWGAVAVAYAPPAQLDARREQLLSLLTAGEPDLKDSEATSIADFFAGVELLPSK
jgi:hypothetical protein